MPPLVSVIVPFFNTPSRFFEEAIESVIAQTYVNWELLLVDDGSSGESVDVAKRYIAAYGDKIFYLEHEGHQNKGVSSTRQLGVSNATGDYVAFLDSDDVWLPEKLEQQVPILESRPEVGMVYGNTMYWSSWSAEAPSEDFVPNLGVKPEQVIPPPELLNLFLSGKAAAPCTCSALSRSRGVDEVGGFEDRFRTLYEDQVFFSKVCLEIPVYVSNRCWDKYRQHASSCCAIAIQQASERAARIAFLEWLDDYLTQRGYRGRPVWNVVQNELWWINLRPGVRRFLRYVRPGLRSTSMPALVKPTARKNEGP